MVGGVILIFLYLVALLAGFVAPYRYDRQDRDRFFHPPTWLRLSGFHLVVPRYEQLPGSFNYRAVSDDAKPIPFLVHGDEYKLFGLIPATLHLFGTGDDDYPVYLLGTDQFGRDIFSRLLYGSQISLSIGVIGILLSFTLRHDHRRHFRLFRRLDGHVIMRLCELIMSIPGAVSDYFAARDISAGHEFRAGLCHDHHHLEFHRLGEHGAGDSRHDAVAARTAIRPGRPRARSNRILKIIVRHILPNTFSYVIVAATLSVPYYILGEVVLSFLGVGIQEPNASWGNMLTAAQNTEYLRNYPWLLAPGAAIFVTVLAFNFLGDGLRDAADTKA